MDGALWWRTGRGPNRENERNMKLLSQSLLALGLIASTVSIASAAGVTARKLTRKVTYSAIQATSITPVRIAGRTIEGKITFAGSLGGTPTGNATEACGRVNVYASKYVPAADGDLFGHDEVVKTVKATPVDAGDLGKGCKYLMLQLPHSVSLAIDANYTPTAAWTPTCQGNISQITSSKVATITLPNANVKVSLDLSIDYKYCGNLN